MMSFRAALAGSLLSSPPTEQRFRTPNISSILPLPFPE
jgi:hypothetical protein